MATSPGPAAMTPPCASTVATSGCEVDQVSAGTAIGAPCWSSAVAVAVTVRPASTLDADSETCSVVGTGPAGSSGIAPRGRSTCRGCHCDHHHPDAMHAGRYRRRRRAVNRIVRRARRRSKQRRHQIMQP